MKKQIYIIQKKLKTTTQSSYLIPGVVAGTLAGRTAEAAIKGGLGTLITYNSADVFFNKKDGAMDKYYDREKGRLEAENLAHTKPSDEGQFHE